MTSEKCAKEYSEELMSIENVRERRVEGMEVVNHEVHAISMEEVIGHGEGEGWYSSKTRQYSSGTMEELWRDGSHMAVQVTCYL